MNAVVQPCMMGSFYSRAFCADREILCRRSLSSGCSSEAQHRRSPRDSRTMHQVVEQSKEHIERGGISIVATYSSASKNNKVNKRRQTHLIFKESNEKWTTYRLPSTNETIWLLCSLVLTEAKSFQSYVDDTGLSLSGR